MSDTTGTWLGLQRRAKPLVQAGVLLGLGLGGFFDGIVLHQILQFHHMLSAHPDPTVAGDLRLNVLADGLFHAATYVFTVFGSYCCGGRGDALTSPRRGGPSSAPLSRAGGCSTSSRGS